MRQLPVCSRVDVKDSALRCCHASFFPPTRFKAIFTTCKGRQRLRLHMEMLSFSSKPVKGCGSRFAFEAPRYARISRWRYIACSENLFTFMNQDATPHNIRCNSMTQITGAVRTPSFSRECGQKD